jgi:hypothetical protein
MTWQVEQASEPSQAPAKRTGNCQYPRVEVPTLPCWILGEGVSLKAPTLRSFLLLGKGIDFRRPKPPVSHHDTSMRA